MNFFILSNNFPKQENSEWSCPYPPLGVSKACAGALQGALALVTPVLKTGKGLGI